MPISTGCFKSVYREVAILCHGFDPEDQLADISTWRRVGSLALLILAGIPVLIIGSLALLVEKSISICSCCRRRRRPPFPPGPPGPPPAPPAGAPVYLYVRAPREEGEPPRAGEEEQGEEIEGLPSAPVPLAPAAGLPAAGLPAPAPRRPESGRSRAPGGIPEGDAAM